MKRSKAHNSFTLNSITMFLCFIALGVFFLSGRISFERKPKASLQLGKESRIAGFNSLIEKLDTKKIPIKNMTQSLTLVGLEKAENNIRLTLKNGYDKIINGFQVSIGDVGIQEELIYNRERMILPDGTYIIDLPIQEQTDVKGIRITSVAFEDGSSDGDPAFIWQMAEKRLGEQFQLKQAFRLIRKHILAPDIENIEASDRLKSQLELLPVHTEEGERMDYELGLESARNRLLAMVEAIQVRQHQTKQSLGKRPNDQKHFSVRSELDHILHEYESALVSLGTHR